MAKLSFHFRDDGSPGQPPIVFLHAFPLHSGMWQAQHDALASVARCVSFDVGGLGRSALPATPNMLEHVVDDLFTLLDYLHIPSAILCGLSMGGYVALRAVERDAVRVSGLVLANTQPAADGNEAKLRRADGIRKLRAEGVVHYVDNFLSVALSPHTHEHRPDVVANARKLMLDSGIDGMASALVALAARTDSTESLPMIKVPTLVLAGEHDAITPLATVRAMAVKIPNAALHMLPNAGHLSNLEAPDEFNQHLIEHVQRVVHNAVR